MRSGVFLLMLLSVLHSTECYYVAIAPKMFHPGWKYAVQLTVNNTNSQGVRQTVTGNIFNGKKQSMGAGTISFDNGNSALLEIQVSPDLQPDPNNAYSLQLDGFGALDFSNSTALKLSPLSRLPFIQTDRTTYNAGQLIRFRVVIVDDDLVPMFIPKNITIKNSMQSVIARFYCDGNQAVFENTYQLADFPDLGQWAICVQSSRGNVDESLMFTVEDKEFSKFEVTTTVTPDLLIQDSMDQRYVTLSVTAKYTNGKGVKGEAKVTVLGSNKVVTAEMRDTSGKKDIEVDVSRELAAASSGYMTMRVEVKDDTGVTYDTDVTVHVHKQAVRLYYDPRRTDPVYRTNMPLLAVLKITDAKGQALPSEDLTHEVVMRVRDDSNHSNTLTRRHTLNPGQTELYWNLTNINSTAPHLTLAANMMVRGITYHTEMRIQKYRVLGKGTLNARWIGLAPNMTMGDTASFIVDVCNSTNFTTLTYMIVSRGNIQTFGRARAGQRVNVKVTPLMCPKGQLVVYGLTDDNSTELIADSLHLTTQHCQGKRINPKVTRNPTEAGSEATVTVDVEWTDPEKQQNTAMGHHDVYVMALDQRVLDKQGHNDITPMRVIKWLNRFTMNSSVTGWDGGRNRPQRPADHDHHHPNLPSSTGELLESLGLTVLGDIHLLKAAENYTINDTIPDYSVGHTEVSERMHFADTWLWKSGRTDDRGRLSVTGLLPSSITNWVITAFAVRRDTELALTSQPLELEAVDSFYVTLSLPYYVRRGEKLQIRATVFNYEPINMDTTVSLAPSSNYVTSGDSSETILVRRNEAGSATFTIIANQVGSINIRVTATARRSNGVTITDHEEQTLIVKPEGIARSRSRTFPVILSTTQRVFDHNLTLSLYPWDTQDVVLRSKTVLLQVTGDLMRYALDNLGELVRLPYGCGEQNMISTVPNIHALAYFADSDSIDSEFTARAKQHIRQGYARQVQQYRWTNGGFSAFGPSDQGASTWLTAFVLKSFAQARVYVPDAVDMDILRSAIEFLYMRQNSVTGQFMERGRVLQDGMQGNMAKGDALSVYVTICLKEAQKYGIEIDGDKIARAMNYVDSVSKGDAVKDNKLLAALTAYALTLHSANAVSTQLTVDSLITHIVSAGAPWKTSQDTTMSSGEQDQQAVVSPTDVQVTAYSLLALNNIQRHTEAREPMLWLIRHQNCLGGYRSTQDTMVALQAISQCAKNFVKENNPSNNVVVTSLAPSNKPRAVQVDSTNAAILQTVDLPHQTKKVNIYVAGSTGSLVLVKMVWRFHTAAETEDDPPSKTGQVAPSRRQLMVSTKTTMSRPGLYNVQACIKPGIGLDYNGMVVMCMALPSGFMPEDIRESRKQNTIATRIEHTNGTVHFYLSEPQKECINLKIQEKVKVETRHPGTVSLYAYYKPDIMSEANIYIGCHGDGCNCEGGDCSVSYAVKGAKLCPFLLLVCIGAFLSLLTVVE